MSRVVRIDAGAARDLEIIHEYLLQHAGPRAAEGMLEQLLAKAASLEANPLRGAAVPELATLAPHVFRQLHFPPWRIVYAIDGDDVIVLMVLDAWRDLATLLAERLLAMPGRE